MCVRVCLCAYEWGSLTTARQVEIFSVDGTLAPRRTIVKEILVDDRQGN